MNLQLKVFRNPSAYGCTIGEMYDDRGFVCYTLEDVVRDLNDLNDDGDFNDDGEGKVYGKTAIPEGSYDVILSMSNKFKKLLPEILKVPGFKGVRIHSGNTENDTLGCILVGLTRGNNYIGNSRDAMKRLMAKLEKADTISISIQNQMFESKGV